MYPYLNIILNIGRRIKIHIIYSYLINIYVMIIALIFLIKLNYQKKFNKIYKQKIDVFLFGKKFLCIDESTRNFSNLY